MSQRRNPRFYQGVGLTTHRLSEVLPNVLGQISANFKERPDLVLAAWPEVIGPRLAPMTQAVSFAEGVLTVKVRSSTLYSLLSLNDKHKLLNAMRMKFPQTEIERILFRNA